MREQHVKDIKKDLLDLSFEFLYKNGLEKLSIRELCKGTGISMGSVYYWFDCKDELILEIAKHGLVKVGNEIFDYVFENMSDMDRFFGSILDEIEKYKLQLRIIYQIATSPQYGLHMREKAQDLDNTYDSYAKQLAEQMNIPVEKLLPVIYVFISVILDYVVWEDREKTEKQVEFIHDVFKSFGK